MGDKDLEDIISNIGQDEMVAAQKQAQIDRLKQLVKKQKNEMTEQQKIIDDLKSRIENMYDLPADVEQLKRMIGEMRAEINNKDAQLEMAHGDVAQHEAELNSLRTQFDPLNNQLQTYINQVGELRAKLVEVDSLAKMKDQKIQELELKLNAKQENLEKMEQEFAGRVQERLSEFMTTEDEYKERIAKMEAQLASKSEQSKLAQKDSHQQIAGLREIIDERDLQISDLENRVSALEAELKREKHTSDKLREDLNNSKSKIHELQLSKDEIRAKIENEMREELFSQKTQLSDKVRGLEAELMERKLSQQEAVHDKENAMKQMQKYQEMYQTIEQKQQDVVSELDKAKERIDNFESEMAEYKAFKEENENTVVNMQGLMKLFEEEPLFKIFLLLKDIGTMKVDFLQKSLGIPTMTTQKYVEKFVNVGLVEKEEDGSLHLKHPLKKTE